MRKYSRKTYFIKKDFQLRFILRFVMVATAWAGATVLLFVVLALRKMEQARYSSVVDVNSTVELLMPMTVGIHLFSLLAFAGILAYTLRSLWHKLAQPLAKIKSEFARIAAGDLARPVGLRKTDEFQDLAAEVERMRRALRERVVALKEGGLALSGAASELSRSLLEGKAAPAHAESLRAAVDRMNKDAQAFRP